MVVVLIKLGARKHRWEIPFVGDLPEVNSLGIHFLLSASLLFILALYTYYTTPIVHPRGSPDSLCSVMGDSGLIA